MDLKIESRNVTMTPRWKAEIEARMADLQNGHGDLIHGRVTLTKNRHHKKAATVAEVRLVVTLPQRHIITASKKDKTFEEAIRTAFTAAETEVRKWREKRSAHDLQKW
jgi:ribosomal subunit interface protein